MLAKRANDVAMAAHHLSNRARALGKFAADGFGGVSAKDFPLTKRTVESIILAGARLEIALDELAAALRENGVGFIR